MRVLLGFLSGLLGLLAGWAALAGLVVALAGPDRDGGVAMGAVFQVGPIGGIVGFALGVWLFIRKGIVRAPPPNPQAAPAAATRIARPFAIALLAITAGLAVWAWTELIPSPYLTHGYMTLELQFRLPPGEPLPPDPAEIHVVVLEGDQHIDITLDEQWHGHQADRQVILAHATLTRKSRSRAVVLSLPNMPRQTWSLDLGNDPDPTPKFSPWRPPTNASKASADMNYNLGPNR